MLGAKGNNWMHCFLWLLVYCATMMLAGKDDRFQPEQPSCSALLEKPTQCAFKPVDSDTVTPNEDFKIRVKSYSAGSQRLVDKKYDPEDHVKLDLVIPDYQKYFILITGYAADVDQFSDAAKRLIEVGAREGPQYHFVIVISAFRKSLPLHHVYIRAVERVELIAQFIHRLVHDNLEVQKDLSRLHLVGHSLGSHIAGFVGKKFVDDGLIVGRITGLDPAKPCFEDADQSDRLTSSDAAFVDVIHTDACFLGMSRPIGHADFYPDGGVFVSICPSGARAIVKDQAFNVGSRGHGIECRHFAALRLFEESIIARKSYNLQGVQCSDWDTLLRDQCSKGQSTNTMGYFATKPQDGDGYKKFYFCLKSTDARKCLV